MRVERLVLLTKSLRPLPDKWHGIADTELRYRRRYVDLIVNEESRRVFETRSAIVRYLRAFLDARGFSRGRNADAAPDTGRRGRAAVQDAPQCARPRHVSADRAGAVPEAPDGRRFRARVRDQPQLPQRGRVDAAQSRVHDARAVPGVCRLQRSHGDDRGHVSGSRRHPARVARAALSGQRVRSVRQLRAPQHRGDHPGEQSRNWIRCRCAT